MRPGERFLAWIYTGPIGHLYGTVADVTQLWALFVAHKIRHRLRRDGGSDAITGPELRAFHRLAAHLLAQQNQLRIYTMMVGKHPVASVYGIRHRGKFIYYQSGRDPEWEDHSVGLVLVGETFKDAIEEGAGEYDFLRGSEPFKSDWTKTQRRTVRIRIHQGSVRGNLLDINTSKARC